MIDPPFGEPRRVDRRKPGARHDENPPLPKVYQLIEPGPVVLLTTAHKGRANVMTMSWHMMVEFEPPLVACVVSSADYSFAALRATKECGIAIPPLESAPKVVEGVGRWPRLWNNCVESPETSPLWKLGE